jgi:hypothetical protein
VRRLFIVLQIIALSVIPTYAQEADNTNPALDLLWDQIHAQPDDFSVACMPLANRAGATQYNADTPFPLASVSKLIIFIEYTRRVDAGLISLDEMVSLDVLNNYDLPRSNSDAHERFLGQYDAGIQTIRLWDIASVSMIQYSSNAAADFLLDRLGPTDWDSLFQILQVTNTDYPHSMSAVALLMANHEAERAAQAKVPALSISQGEELFDLYLADTEWHQAEVAYRSDQRRLFPGWEVQAAILDHVTAKGTASDFLNVLAAIYDTGGPLSERTKHMVRDALRWQNNDYVDTMYLEYGSKLGFYSGGVLTLVAYGHPYNGSPVISAAFLRNVPRRVYNQMLHQDSIGELAHWMNLNECAGLLNVLIADPPKAD